MPFSTKTFEVLNYNLDSELEPVLVRLAVARALDLVLPEVHRPLPLLPLRHGLEVPLRKKTSIKPIQTRKEGKPGGESKRKIMNN